MLTLAIFYLLRLGSHAAVLADSVDFTPSTRTVIVFGPTPQVVDSLSHETDFQETYSDFNYHLNKVVGYLREKDVVIQEATCHVIRIHSRNRVVDRVVQGLFKDSEGNQHLFGIIVVEPRRAPIVIYGVDTSDGYIQAIEEYYHVR